MVVGTFTLNDCDSVVAQATLKKGEKLPAGAPPVDISEVFTVTASSEADRAREYVIPVDKSRSWAKQLNLALARNSNKTLVSFNGTIADQAGPTLLAAAQTAIAIGGAVALPPAAPLIAAAEVQRARPAAANAAEQLRLKNLSLQGFTGTTDDFIAKLSLTPDRLQIWEPALDAVAERARRTPAPAPVQAPVYCSVPVVDALKQIAVQQNLINDALAKSGAKTAMSGGAQPAAAQTPNPLVTKAQARIAGIVAENNLVRTVRWTWTPGRSDLTGAYKSGYKTVLLEAKAPFFDNLVAPSWFSADGADRARRNTKKDATLTRLLLPLTLDLRVDAWTIGRDYTDAALPGALASTSPKQYPDGIVYRDPALGHLRACLGPCGGAIPSGVPGGIAPSLRDQDEDSVNEAIETTTDLIQLDVPISQFGRFYVEKMGSSLFETSIATLTQNLDGSIASVGAQSSNSAAAGFASATAAANSESAAIAAKNTAVGAVNTANASSAALVDTINKNIADCYTQQATITAHGGHPVGACQ